MKPLRILLLVPLAGCVLPVDNSVTALRPGSFLEAKGRVVDGKAQIDEIDEVPRGVEDTSDKVEVTGPVEAADQGRVRMLGHDFEVVDKTDYEDEAKNALDPFVPATGDWLRIKARIRDDGLRARTLRQMAARDQFKVAGEVRRVDDDLGWLDVGGIVLPLAQDVDVELTGGRDPDDPLSLFLADDQKAVPFSLRVGDTLRLGGQGSTTYEWNDEYDLDRTDDGDRTKPSVGGKLDALWLFDDRGSYALGEVSFGRRETRREGGETTRDDQLEVTRAFASLRATSDVQLLLGRQDFDEDREWLYDEVLDGVRAVVHFGELEVEAAAAVGREVAAEDNELEDTGLYVGNLRYHPEPDWMLGAYLLQRTDDTAADFEPLLYGVRSIARPRYGLGHWVELGGAAGEAGGVDIRGYAVDAGLLYTFDHGWRPALGAGVAFANGERDGAARMGYRQSGLQDNNGKLGGVTSVRYYGEVFRPELANITILTASVAVRPLPGFSVSLLLHSYRQDVAAGHEDAALPLDDLTDLRTSSNAVSRDLGREIDLVLGYRLRRQLTLEFVYGRFEPGDAFDTSDAATLIDFTARYSF